MEPLASSSSRRPSAGRVLRARTPAGVDQEVHALLVTYQVLRTAMAGAASTVPGTGPGHASFSVALDAARDWVILAAGPVTGLAGRIGERVLARLMPARHLRASPRVVKRAISKYNARDKPGRTTRKVTVAITIRAAPLDRKQRSLTTWPCR